MMTRLEVDEDVVAVDVGQAQVEQDHVRSQLVGHLQPFLARGRGVDLDVVLGEDLGDQRANVALVVDDQDAIHDAVDSSPSGSR
jgi:hypothetical protein